MGSAISTLVSAKLQESDRYLGHSNHLSSRKRPSENASNSDSKKQRISDKQDICFHKGNFHSARIVAHNAQKWLLVNIEHSERLDNIFSQNDELKILICHNFVVWQEYLFNRRGKRYKQFYGPVEFPYIAILDPITGDKLNECHNFGSTALLEFIRQFVSDHQNPTEKPSESLLSSSGASPLSSDMTHVQETSAIAEQNNIEDTESRPKNNSKVDTKNAIEAWKLFLGGEKDPKLYLVIRLPNGERKEICWACTTRVKSLYLYIEGMGYDMKEYEITTNEKYEIATLTQQDLEKTLEEVNLCNGQVLFLKLKDVSF